MAEIETAIVRIRNATELKSKLCFIEVLRLSIDAHWANHSSGKQDPFDSQVIEAKMQALSNMPQTILCPLAPGGSFQPEEVSSQ